MCLPTPSMNARIRKLLEDRILTTHELSQVTGMSEVAIRKRVERGQLPCVKKGRTYLFDQKDVDAFGLKVPTRWAL